MTSYETAELLSKTIDSLTNTDNLNELLLLCDELHDAYQNVLYDAVGTGDSTKRAATFESIREAFSRAYFTKLVEVRSRKVYADLEGMLSALAVLNIPQEVNELEDKIPLTKLLSKFIDTYENFLHTRTTGSVLRVLNVGHDLLLSITLFINTLSLIKHNLEAEPITIPPQYQGLSLYLSSEDSYRDVLSRLNTVSELYSELCSLMDISAAEYPLQIIKIETGSLWLKVFGESKVISLLIKLIESGAHFMYRRFTTEGKMQTIPRQVEAIESVLHLAENLEKLGVDTTQLKDNLQKSSVIISNELNNLLQGVASLKINDETISVGNAFDEKFLKQSSGLFLEDSNEKAGAKERFLIEGSGLLLEGGNTKAETSEEDEKRDGEME